MKFIITLCLLLQFLTGYSQWTRVTQLPAFDMFTVYHHDSILYAGGKNKIYFSGDNGQTWDSTHSIPSFIEADNIIVYKNELYTASYSIGVYKSNDQGITWQNISTGIAPFVSDFCEWKGDLYATTLGNSVFKLDPVSHNKWLPFSNGLSSLSANINSIAATSNTLVAGTRANGMYDYLPPNSTTWEERFFLNHISPTEGIHDIVTGHDSLFLTGYTGRSYISIDNGLNWDTFGGRLPRGLNASLVNLEQALLASESKFDGFKFISTYHYIKKDSLHHPFVQFSLLDNHFTYKLDVLENKIWNASANGLFYMSLSDLPGITVPNNPIGPLPVHFISFNAYCENNSVVMIWETAQEQNSDHFNIERSVDGTSWSVIGSRQAAGNSTTEKSYSFTDKKPPLNNLYRIAEYDINGKVQYTNIARSYCNITDEVKLWPNPVHEIAFINIVAGNDAHATINVFDSKGALVKKQNTDLFLGSNRINVDMRSFANGIYQIHIDGNNGKINTTISVLKQ